MKQIFFLITFFLIGSALQAQTSTNPVYLNYDSNLDWATYISATGSVSNQPSMFFHLPYVGTSGNAIFEWDADDSGTRKTIYRFETSSDRIFEINGWNDGNSSDLWFGDDNDSKFYIADDGHVGIGTVTPSYTLDVSGSLGVSDNVQINPTKEYLPFSTFASSSAIGFSDGYIEMAEHLGSPFFVFGSNVVRRGAGVREVIKNGDARELAMTASGTLVYRTVLDATAGDLVGNEFVDRFVVTRTGEMGIGTTSPSNKLEVNGTIRSKEVVVEATNWPDYVFEEDYDLPTLSEIEAFIKANKHLPEVPSAKEMEANGISLGEMNMLLLKKIEELTLITIQQQKQINELIKRDE